MLNASTAVGVEIVSVDKSGSPSTAIANEIAPAVPPVGTAIFPLNSTLYFALQVLVAPLRLINPLPVLCEIYPLLHTDVGASVIHSHLLQLSVLQHLKIQPFLLPLFHKIRANIIVCPWIISNTA